MKITVEENLSALSSSLHHELGVIVLWVEFTRRSNPLTIHVRPHQTTPVIAHNNPVGVQHWNNLKDKGVSQQSCVVLIAD